MLKEISVPLTPQRRVGPSGPLEAEPRKRADLRTCTMSATAAVAAILAPFVKETGSAAHKAR
jgi:hypothetical protein